MLRNVSCTECTELIGDIIEVIKRELDILVVVPFEAVEEVAKSTDSLITLC